MPGSMPFFAAATLLPLALIVLGAVLGGPWIWAACLWMAALTATLDALIARSLPAGEDREFPAADGLSVMIALGQLAMMALVVRVLALPGPTAPDKLALFVAAGLYCGQVGNSNAHELIHRPGRFLRGLGKTVYVAQLFGHHASAHVLVHHVRVATRADPSTARRGESLYRFIGRAWRGSFREGFRAESARLQRAGRPGWRHPYVAYLGGAALVLGLALLLGGWRGLCWHLGLAGFATVQLLMSDYVQHYGLMRALRPDGRPEPVGSAHAWNAPHPASSALMLNAPRHSDHHAHPLRRYPALRLPGDAPLLPHALPVMAVIALVPPLWRRVMDARLAALRGAAP